MGYVLSGIRDGFWVGFDYSKYTCVSATANLRSAGENRQVVEDYLKEECAQGRIIRMGMPEAVEGLHFSPFRVIPKGHQTGKWRLIVDLSSPHGRSVNDGIDSELCTLSYISVDDVAKTILALGRGALMVKVDIKNAYRLMPVCPDDPSAGKRGTDGEGGYKECLPIDARVPGRLLAVRHGVAGLSVCRHGSAIWATFGFEDLHRASRLVGMDILMRGCGSRGPLSR